MSWHSNSQLAADPEFRPRAGVQARAQAQALLAFALICSAVAAPEAVSAQESTRLIGPGTDVEVSPDGTVLVYDCVAGQLCVYDLATDVETAYDTGLTAVDSSHLALSNGAKEIVFAASDPDASGRDQVFVYVRATAQLDRLSETSEGIVADNAAFYPSITPDGRFVLFQSSATNLGTANPEEVSNLFVVDRTLDTIEAVTLGHDGSPAEAGLSITISIYNRFHDISDDGDCVAFSSDAVNMVGDDTNGNADAFLHRRSTGVTQRVSVDSQGREVDTASVANVAVAGDCSVVAFVGDGRDFDTDGLDADKTSREDAVFLHVLDGGDTFMISGRPDGSETPCLVDDTCVGFIIDTRHDLITSRDGRFTAFQSAAPDLVADDTNGYVQDIFVYDRVRKLTTLQSIQPSGAQFPGDPANVFGMSGDGGSIAFRAYDGGDQGSHIYLRDRGDVRSPFVAQLRTEPGVPATTDIIDILATASDRLTGDSLLLQVEYAIDAGAWTPMAAQDGAMDNAQEPVTATVPAGSLAEGDHAVCVRATDVWQNTSSPACITVTVSDAVRPVVEGWQVYCRHRPLLPQPGDDVEIYVDSLPVRDGVIDNTLVAAVERIEVWVDDTQAPAATSSGLVDTFTHVVQDVQSGSLAYGCRVVDEGDVAFSGWRRVAVGPQEARAIPVHFTGPSAERIDLVFFHDQDNYTGFDDPNFSKDVEDLIRGGYISRLWFAQHQRWFNVWIARDSADFYRNDDDDRDLVKPANFDSDYAMSDAAIIVHTENKRDFARGGAFSIDRGEFDTIAHESGHRPFGLADEYCCDGGNYQAEELPNLWEQLEDCETDAPLLGRMPEDCSSFLNVDGERWFRSEPDDDDLMRDNGRPRAADLRRMDWLIDACMQGGC